MRPRASIVAGLTLLGGLALAAGRPHLEERGTFPHEKHAHLFPSCKGCHAILRSESPGALVSATGATCARCHDGAALPAVTWQPDGGRASNLIFSHDLHVKENGLDCATCHEAEGSPGGMAPKQHPRPEVCVQCHDAKSHLDPGNDCRTCHQPLARALELSADRVSEFPAPDDHGDPAWWKRHGAAADSGLARCAICHARETCATCHLNTKTLKAIQGLPPDPRVADQVAVITPSWPKPASHDSLWTTGHGPAAQKEIAACATCHAQASCSGCHGPKSMAPPVVGKLPVPAAEGPTGVTLAGRMPPGHTAEFARRHGVAALTGRPRCGACHEPADFCGRCHEAPKAPEFHPANYLARHAADVYAHDLECASCHSTETFCRSCHEAQGLSTRRPKNASYHDAEPFWLLNHGQAARQGLDACAACHQQKDCLRCHSARAGWRISPHGPDFDARRLGEKNPMMCARCHFTTPVP